MGGLPGGTPSGGWSPGTGGGGGGGGNVGLSRGLGVGIFADDEDDEDEHMFPGSEGDPDAEPECPAPEVAPPGEGALRARSSLRGALQDSGVRSCTPGLPSDFPSPAGCMGLHRPAGRAAWVSL